MTQTLGQTQSTRLQTDAPARPPRALPQPDSLLPISRRRQMRFAVHGLVAHSPVFAQVVEVSADGLRLESQVPVVVGARYVFRLNYGTRFLHLPGRVAWCRIDRFEETADGTRVVFEAGVELAGDTARTSWRAALAHRAGVALGA